MMTSRDSASMPANFNKYSKKCVICGNSKHNNIYEKWRISEKGRAKSFLKAAMILQDDVFTRTSDLQDANAVFGADLYCHSLCIRNYIRKGEKATSESSSMPTGQQKYDIFKNFMKDLEPGLNSGRCYNLTYISRCCNEVPSNAHTRFQYTNRDVKMYLIHMFGEDVSFFVPTSSKKPTIVFKPSAVEKEPERSERLLDRETIKKCGTMLRNCILNEDFELNDRFCDANELEKAYSDMIIPSDVADFFSALFDIDILHSDNIIDGEPEIYEESYTRSSKMKKVLSVYQVIFYIVNNSKKRTPLHILNSEAIYNVCRSQNLSLV